MLIMERQSNDYYSCHRDSKTDVNTVAFVFSKSDITPITKYCSANYDSVVVVAVNHSLAKKVRKEGYDCSVLSDYLSIDSKQELRKEVVFWIDEWADKNGNTDDSIKKRLLYKDFSLWWFALPVLYPDVLRCVQYIEAFQAIISLLGNPKVVSVRPNKKREFPLRLNRDRELPRKIIEAVCKQEDLLVHEIRETWVNYLASSLYHYKIRFMTGFYYYFGQHLVSSLRRLLLNFGRINRSSSKLKNILVFSTSLYWRETFNHRGDVVEKDTIANSGMEELISRGYNVIGIDTELNTPNIKRLKLIKQKRNSEDILWYAIEGLGCKVPVAKVKERRKAIQKLHEKWIDFVPNNVPMVYGQIDIMPLIAGRFDFLFRWYFNQALSYYEAIEEAVKKWNPLLFTTVYEEGAYGRAATLVGQDSNIPTMAIQHGMISGEYIPAYYFKSVRFKKDSNTIACPIPFRTAVYGQHTKDILTKISAYPEESVEVVGMASHDTALRLLREGKLKFAKKALGIKSKKRIFLVVSQPFFTPEDKNFFISCILDLAQIQHEMDWVIKLHPSENGKDWENAIKARGMQNNLRLTYDMIQAWLVVSTFVISWNSTVILEAALFGKVIFALRIPGSSNAEEYISSGIAYGVNNTEDLLKILNDLSVNSEKKSLKDFNPKIKKYVLQPRESTSKNVADLAQRLINGK